MWRIRRFYWDVRARLSDWYRPRKLRFRKWRGTAGEEISLDIPKLNVSTRISIRGVKGRRKQIITRRRQRHG